MIIIMMERLCSDTVRYIGRYLLDRDKVSVIEVSKTYNNLKHMFVYRKHIKVDKIRHISYFDNFLSVILSHKTEMCPKNAKHIYWATEMRYVPPNVTHLTFCNGFNQSVKDIIPP